MPRLSANDIRRRNNDLKIISESPAKVNIKTLFKHVHNQYSFNNAKTVLENWRSLSKDESLAFQQVLEIFQLICDNDSESHIRNAEELIEGRILHKVRDGKALRHLNNYKTGKFKIPNTKVEKQTHANATVTQRDWENKGKHVNTLHPNRKYKYDMFNNKQKEKTSSKSADNKEEEKKTSKEETIEECYNKMIAVIETNQQCDRVLNNHERLSKRFNLDSIVRECHRNEDAYRDCIFELCNLIDSYDISIGAKYGIALENIMYLMNKNCIPVQNEVITEAVTDYFLLNSDANEDIIHDIKYVIENSRFFEDSDFDRVAYLFEGEDPDFVINTTEQAIDTILEFHSNKPHIQRDEKGKKIKPVKTTVSLKSDKKSTVRDELNRFKMSHDKSIQGLKKCIYRVFCNSPENIVKGLPDVFSIVRGSAIIGMFGVNPLLGVFGTITGAFLKMDISRKQMREVIAQYDKEISRYEEKLSKAKDEKAKEKYKQYIKKLKADRDKLDEREDKLYTDEDNEKRREEKDSKRSGSSSSDSDMNFDDWNFDEVAKYFDNISSLTESMNWNVPSLMNTIRNSINDISGNDIPVLTEAVIACRDVFDLNEYKSILEYERHRLRSEQSSSRYLKIDPINLALYDLQPLLKENASDCPTVEIEDAYERAHLIQETVQDILELLEASRKNVLNEGNISTNIKLAADKLGKTAVKLKDKDRKISKDIDVTLGHFAQAAERSLTNDRREAVIKGSLLPSASKTIKAALITGAAWALSPALAVIGAIGAIATSKKLQRKERQIILDDIEIELKMCDKYLRLAEERNDLKATRNILQTQRALERQRSRLRYNMKVNWNEKVPNVAGDKSYDEAVNFEEKYLCIPGTTNIID